MVSGTFLLFKCLFVRLGGGGSDEGLLFYNIYVTILYLIIYIYYFILRYCFFNVSEYHPITYVFYVYYFISMQRVVR